jgi:hypothetical protein
MNRTEPKYRRPLNPNQLHLLKVIYKFRFVSAESLAKRGTKTEVGGLRKRLSVLADQGYIGRNYDGSYRLQNKPASYFLLPKGILAIKSQAAVNQSGLKAAYKDRTASPQFIDHCLKAAEVYKAATRLYGDKFKFASKTELAANEGFPKLKPDFCLLSKNLPAYFLDIVDDSIPTFAYRKKVLAYINHFDYEWDLTEDTPPLLIVCGTLRIELRLRGMILKLIRNIEPDLEFHITTIDRLETARGLNQAWEAITDTDL